MTDKYIKLDGSTIPIEQAIKAGLISENDIKKKQINYEQGSIIIDGVDVAELKAENEKLKEENRNYSSLIWYIYCGSEDNLAEDVIGEYYNAKNECDNKYLDIFWKKIGNLEQTEYRLKKHSYKQLLEQLDQLKVDNEELKKCYKNNLALLDFEETNTTKLVNKVMKLEKTLSEIKEIAEEYRISNSYYTPLARKILQKISEVIPDEN